MYAPAPVSVPVMCSICMESKTGESYTGNTKIILIFFSEYIFVLFIFHAVFVHLLWTL